MDASTYTAEVTAEERPETDVSETETTRVFRPTSLQALRRLSLMALASGNTARALKSHGR